VGGSTAVGHQFNCCWCAPLVLPLMNHLLDTPLDLTVEEVPHLKSNIQITNKQRTNNVRVRFGVRVQP